MVALNSRNQDRSTLDNRPDGDPAAKGPEREARLFPRQVERLPMRPKYTNVRARSANVGSGTGGWSLAGGSAI
jgi:hypothetical protein